MEITAPHEARGPCAGYRVLDFSTVVSGPLCTQILGDPGADVVKVETASGDILRHGRSQRAGLSGYFAQFNRNKRSMVLDVKTENGQRVAHRLAPTVDVLVENFRPGVADRLGIGYDALRAGNPGLIYVAISGFGPDGPYTTQPAYDLLMQGLVGIMPIQGGDSPPQMVKSLVADKCTALTAATATVAALLARERRGGVGQRIDVPMLDAFAAYVLPDLIPHYTFQPLDAPPAPPPDIYQTGPRQRSSSGRGASARRSPQCTRWTTSSPIRRSCIIARGLRSMIQVVGACTMRRPRLTRIRSWQTPTTGWCAGG